MRNTRPTTRVFMSEAKFAELRLDVARRRRSLTVNETIYGVRHGQRLAKFVATRLKPAEATALSSVLETLATGERWTDASTRRLTAALAPVRRAFRLSMGDADDETSLGWHLARLAELVAQHETLRHLEAVLMIATTEPLPSQLHDRSARARDRRLRLEGRRPAFPPAA